VTNIWLWSCIIKHLNFVGVHNIMITAWTFCHLVHHVWAGRDRHTQKSNSEASTRICNRSRWNYFGTFFMFVHCRRNSQPFRYNYTFNRQVQNTRTSIRLTLTKLLILFSDIATSIFSYKIVQWPKFRHLNHIFLTLNVSVSIHQRGRGRCYSSMTRR
jgi:hypothetical protein